MKLKALKMAFPRKSRLGTFLSLAITASLLTPLVPAAFSASGSNAPVSAPRASTSAAPFAVAPSITATKSDAFPDPDNDGRAVPGDTITYTVQITNNGTDATGVVFSDTVDANTTYGGTFTTTPVAIDDSYSAIGNVQINVPAASGLTSNDSDPDGGPVTAVAGTTTSTNGGNVTVNADGSFNYNPPPGFEGADTFTYTVNGASAPSNTATVTVNVAGMIWFVNSSAGAGGDGRLTSPFNALTGVGSFDAVAADQPNDNIFLYSGAYTGGLTLLSGQALIGAGATASLATITGLTPPSYSAPLPATGGSNPVIGGASGISIATNNLIRGVTIQNGAGTGISGSAFGTLAVADTAVDSTGPALVLDNGQLQASFQSLASTSSATPGISLTNIAVGSLFSGGTTTINSRGATGIELNLVQGVIGFGATTIPNPNTTGGYGIRVRNSGAAVTFDSATISNAHLTIAQADANNDLIPETDGDGDAIFLSNNTGSFAVNGGTLSNCGNDCVDARNSSNVSLANVGINNPGVDVTNASAAGTGGSGIQGINLSGTNSLTSVNVQNFNKTGRDGMRLVNNATAAMTMTVGNSLFADSTATNGNGIVISGRDNANMALVVQNNSTFQNLLGPAIAHRAGDNVNSTATVNLTVQNSTFQNSQPLGQNTVQASVTQGAKATVLADGNTFNNVARTVADTSGIIDINGNGTLAGNSLSFTATNNIITNIGNNTPGSCGALPCTSRRGIDVFIADSTSVSGTIVIDGNQITDVKRAGIVFDISNVFNGSNVAAKITNNTVGTNALRVGTGNAVSAGGESGINIQNRNNSGKSLNLNLSGNSVRNGNGGAGSALNTPGVFIRDQNTSSLDATLGANDIETSTSVVVAELRVDTSNAGSTLCLDANGNILDAGNGRIALNETAGALNVEQGSAALLASANGIPAANVTVSGTPQFGITCANPPLAMFRTNTSRDYLAALNGPSAKAAQGSASLSAARSNFLSEMLPGLDSWRSNWKQALGGLSYRNAPSNVALGSYLRDAAVRPARESAPEALAYAPAAAAPQPFSGETFNINIGTLPAGKSITITFQATISNSINTTQVSNQGTVSGSNFGTVFTDDPDTGAFGDPTVTLVGTPATISCPANITTNTDPGQFSASVAFSVTATGTPAPTVDCKIGATSITSPHTFPAGTTTVQCTATNGIGSPASCSFNVTVNDNQTPTISCPADITTTTAPNSCDATVNVGTPTVNDNDPGVTVNGTRSDALALNAPYPKGTTTITWTATDTAGNSASCQQTITVNDATAPVITLNGASSMTVECHTSFTDPGATASDNCGSVPVNVSGSVDANTPGTYTLTYNATDTSGNAANPVTRTVTVVDTTVPIITLNGSSSMTVECHTSFADPGATATDACDTSVPVSVSGSVNVNAPGVYTLTYNASDDSGNAATPVTRTVTVVDTIKPVITVNGANPMTIECHTSFTDPGATASDSCDSSVPVSVSGSVNANVPGTYTLTYNASDDSGNAATPKTRTVIVVDTLPPSISCQADIFVNYDPAVGGAVVNYTTPVGTDSCSGALVATRTTGLASGAVFPLGTTTNTFVVTDGAGHTASCSFKVTVGLTSIVGLNSVSISGSSYADSYDSNIGYPASKGSQANIVSNGTITLAGSGKVFGDVRSTQAGIVMTGASQVTGNATAATTVSKSGSASVGGTTTNNSPATPVTLPSVSACGPPYSSNAGISGTYSYNAGTGDLNLSGINVATLANGTYCFHNVTVSNSAELKVNGPVVIKMTGTLNVSGAAKLNNTTAVPGNLRILSSYSGSNGVSFGNSASSYLLVYAPQTGVTISGAGPLFGTVAGKSITISNSGALHYDTRLMSIWFDLWLLL